MVPLYSAALGRISVTDHGVAHTLYTVPLTGGPAVVRSVALGMNPGAEVFFYVDDGIDAFNIVHDDAIGSSLFKVGLYSLHQVIEPGWTLNAFQAQSGAVLWSAMAAGYQFTS